MTHITPKAICTDIDGTLLNAERGLSQRTINNFLKIKEQIPVILVSSRMPSAMTHLQKQLQIEHMPLVCYNGGFILLKKSENTILDSVKISFELCSSIGLWCEENNLHASFYAEDDWFAPTNDEWTAREINNTKVKATISPVHDVLEDWSKGNKKEKGAHKIMCMGKPEKIEELISMLRWQGAELHLYRSKDTYLEIAPLAISKATALNKVLGAEFNMSLEDCIAFGDNYNDIDMLQGAGIGVAVGNAKKEVKEVADEITSPGKEDGVAITLEKYFS